MAITIPILTEFNGSGVAKATKSFKDLQGAGAKAGYAVRKAAIPAGIALTALGAAAIDAVKGAMADQAAQEQLARTLQASTKATNQQVAAVEEFITKTSMAASVSDDELRPALAILARGTGDLTKAQQGLGLALDIAAGTGKPLAQVSEALSKAYAGNLKGLNALDPRMKTLIKNGASAEEAMAILSKTFKGDAAAAADTASGKMKGLGIALDETKEALGAALLPALEAVLGPLQSFAKWAQENPKVFMVIAGTIAGIAAAIIAVNVAMSAMAAIGALTNPIGLVIVALAALAAGVIYLWKTSDDFRDGMKAIWANIKDYVLGAWNVIKGVLQSFWDTISGVVTLVKGIINGDWSQAWEGAKQIVSGVFGWMKATMIQLPAIIVGLALNIGEAIVTGIVNGTANLGEKVWNGIKGLASFLKTQAAEWIEDLGGLGTSVIKWIASTATGLGAAIWNNISGFAGVIAKEMAGIASDLKAVGENIIDWITGGINAAAAGLVKAAKAAINLGIGALNTAIGALNKPGDIINAVLPGDPVPDIPLIPKLAKGGIVRQPTLALIGEAGPEAVIPLNRAGGAGGITINIEAGLVSTPDQVGQQIIEAIQRAQRRSGPVFAPA